jgi:hypothetical protein
MIQNIPDLITKKSNKIPADQFSKLALEHPLLNWSAGFSNTRNIQGCLIFKIK